MCSRATPSSPRKYSGSEIKLDGEDYMIMREDEVLGILDAAAPKTGHQKATNTSF